MRASATPRARSPCAARARDFLRKPDGPQDIDVAEVHDAFSIAKLLITKAFAFCQRAKGRRCFGERATSLSGRIPINPSGGLLAKGHPVGATGRSASGRIVANCAVKRPTQCRARRWGMTHAPAAGSPAFDHAPADPHFPAVIRWTQTPRTHNRLPAFAFSI